MTTREDGVIVRFEGPLPVPETASLRADLIQQGVDPASVRAELLPRDTIDFGEPST